jgi:hypothetical protein
MTSLTWHRRKLLAEYERFIPEIKEDDLSNGHILVLGLLRSDCKPRTIGQIIGYLKYKDTTDVCCCLQGLLKFKLVTYERTRNRFKMWRPRED